MKLIVVHIGNVKYYPPVLNMLNILDKMKEIETVFITTKTDMTFVFDNINIQIIPVLYENYSSYSKLFLIPRIRKKLWHLIDEEYKSDTIIWITYSISLKCLGKKIIKKRYILQLMELTEKLYYHHRIKFFKLDEVQIGNNAMAVVVPEYNRAHIVKAWWNLEKCPFILPNSPHLVTSIEKNADIKDVEAKKIIDSLADKKIILYQGILNEERPLDVFIRAVDRLGDEYAFVIMSNSENIYSNMKCNNFYFIPFVSPPAHLEITSHAYIGVLSYIPFRNSFSVLNAVYCAPNKLYEYAMFGIPMIGNDIPGLRFVFETSGLGYCISDFVEENVISAIKKIELNYEFYGKNSANFYCSMDLEQHLKKILEFANSRLQE